MQTETVFLAEKLNERRRRGSVRSCWLSAVFAIVKTLRVNRSGHCPGASVVKILLGTHHLEMRAGSELFAAELIASFQARGHEVAAFTFFKGEIGEVIEANGTPVFETHDKNAMVRFQPDIVQTCHIPCAHFLRAIFPDAVRVHAMLGAFPPLEAPPLGGDAYGLGLAVSEEVLDRINKTSFAQDVETVIFRNWYDDEAVKSAARRQNTPQNADGRRLRVAVISHHVAPELIAALTALENAGAVKAEYFGVQYKTVVVDGDFLANYDLVVSIGRTALLAAACGIPCIMADIHGSDGLLTAGNLDAVRTVNFSGRLHRHPITKTHIQEQIDQIPAHDREQLRGRVTAAYSLRARAEWLLSRYEELLAEARDGTRTMRPKFEAPSEGLVHAEIAITVRGLRGTVRELEEKLDAAHHRIAAMNRRGIGQRVVSTWQKLTATSKR
jgi:hypothetical protein